MKTWERAVMLRRSFLSLPPPLCYPLGGTRLSPFAAAVLAYGCGSASGVQKKHLTNKLMNM